MKKRSIAAISLLVRKAEERMCGENVPEKALANARYL